MRISDWSSDVCSSDLAETLDPGKHALGLGDVGEILAHRRQIGVKLHAIEDILVVEGREAFEVEDEIEAARRAIAPFLQQLFQSVGDRRRIAIIAPKTFAAPAQAIMQLQEVDDIEIGRAKV